MKAALDGRTHGLVDNWLRHVKDVAAKHADALDATVGIIIDAMARALFDPEPSSPVPAPPSQPR